MRKALEIMMVFGLVFIVISSPVPLSRDLEEEINETNELNDNTSILTSVPSTPMSITTASSLGSSENSSEYSDEEPVDIVRAKRQCNILNSLSNIFRLGSTMTPYNVYPQNQYPGTYYDVRGQPIYTG
ncbi:unnamed protein product [Diamesa serratosioi]